MAPPGSTLHYEQAAAGFGVPAVSTPVVRASALAPSMRAESITATLRPPGGHALELLNDELSAREALPRVGAAMLLHVRFLGGEVPLWALIAPLVIVGALISALAAAAVSEAPASVAPSASGAPLPVAPGSASSAASSPQSPDTERKGSSAPAPSKALPETLDVSPGKLRAEEVIEIAERRASQQLSSARALVESLDRDPGLVQEPKILSELRRLADDPETARVVLKAVSALPPPLAADLLYEIWTADVERTETTDVARALLYSSDVRPKASPALAVALDLRVAEKCEDYRPLLTRARQVGDRRSLHLLSRMQRRYGCGPTKRQDCYPCVRSGDDLELAVKAVKERREPRVFGKR